MTTPTPAGRRARYAAAIRETDGWVLDEGQHMIDAVMAVADTEQADLRAELDKLIRWHKEDGAQAVKAATTITRLRAQRAELIRQRDQIAMDTIKALPAPADRAAIRDRIRRAICEASGFTWLPDELMEPDEYGEHADAVLAALATPPAAPAVPKEAKARLLWSDLLGAAPDITGGACTQCCMDRARDRDHDMSPDHAHCRAVLDDPAP